MNDHPDDRDLTAIRVLMEEAEGGVPEAGKHLVLWGVVIALALVGTYLALGGAPLSVAAIWAVSLAAGWGLSLWVGWRDEWRAPVLTLLARVVAGIWIGCGVTATVVSVLGLTSGAFPPAALPGTVALVLAAGFFASSFAYRSAWMRALSAAWWIGGAAMLLRPGPSALLVMAGMLLALQVVPGLVLCRRERLRRAVSGA